MIKQPFKGEIPSPSAYLILSSRPNHLGIKTKSSGKVVRVKRPASPPHDGTIYNPSSFNEAWCKLSDSGLQNLETKAGTPFTAKAHVPGKGSHKGEKCILVQRPGYYIYIYECCWGHETNCAGTYIDRYSPII